MAILWNKTQDQKLLSDLRVAATMWPRLKGLLGTDHLEPDQGLWIHACNSIHTFFMRYPIDCVFLDQELKVYRLLSEVRPGKIVWPQWGATSVLEIQAGTIKRWGIRLGDQLNVGT